MLGNEIERKPLGRKNYGHIPHLPSSRMGPGDHKCHRGQATIATVKTRDKHDEVIVQEKLDGSNVGVARIDGVLHPLGRAGWTAVSSPHLQHRHFHNWVFKNYDRFMNTIKDGERLVGEWLIQAHGTRYELRHEPFVAFDLMIDSSRLPYDEFLFRLCDRFVTPTLLHRGCAFTVNAAMSELGMYGHHGAIDPVEGVVWRVERDKQTRKNSERIRIVDFLVKYVRPDKEDGLYLKEDVLNLYPGERYGLS